MPLTFAAVSGSPVLDEDSAWQAGGGWFQHIDAARRADVLVVAPATANTVAKMAAGIADNLLTAIYLAFRGPVVVAPSANWAMYEHPATQENLRRLARARRARCCRRAKARWPAARPARAAWPSPTSILAAVKRAFAAAAAGPLAGRKVVVTAGGTREPLDAVRFIGNRSSGKMGRAVAADAYLRGADVVLIDATHATPTIPYRRVAVETADEMAAAVATEAADADVLVMAAAVADFKPARPQTDEKIDRAGREQLTVELVPTVDILAASRRAGLLRVGFAAEAGPRLERARAKKAAKDVDLLVFNDILAAGVGIGSDENEIVILTPSEEIRIAAQPQGRSARGPSSTRSSCCSTRRGGAS